MKKKKISFLINSSFINNNGYAHAHAHMTHLKFTFCLERKKDEDDRYLFNLSITFSSRLVLFHFDVDSISI